jgi:ribosome-binding factor A
MTARTDRVDELLRQEIGVIIAREIADPRVGFATVTSVVTTPDLRHAKVLVSVIGQAADRKATLTALGRAMPFVRHELGKRLRIKRIPEFHLELDDTLERGTRVLLLLNELEAGHVPDGEAPVGESLPTPVARLPHEGDAAPQELPEGAEAEGAEAPPGAASSRKRRVFRPSNHARNRPPQTRRRR